MKKILFFSTILLFFAACDDQLDLTPPDQLTLQSSFANETLTRGVLTGVYSASQQDDVLNGTFQLMGEWMADNVDFVGSFPTFRAISEFNGQANSISISNLWDDNYETLGTANLVIAFTDGVDDDNFTAAEKANVIAQAKFMRALIYFNLSNAFSQPTQVSNGTNLSVPLVLEPFTDEVTFPARATLAEVQAQIERDLLDAIPDLTNEDNSVATQGAAQGLLSRLYLYQERWGEAAQLANDVISSGDFTLASNYDFYNTMDREFLFTLVNTAMDGQDSNEGFSGLANPAPDGRGDAPYTDNLIAAYDTEVDRRYIDLVQEGPDADQNVRTFTSKFPDGITNADNAPVLRITEMYLTRAEANFQAGTAVGAEPVEDINILRERAGLEPLASVTLEQILDERRKELCFEGHRRMDLLRNRMNLRRPGMPDEALSAFGADRTIFPIPTREIDLNPNLVQNPGF